MKNSKERNKFFHTKNLYIKNIKESRINSEVHSLPLLEVSDKSLKLILSANLCTLRDFSDQHARR